VFPNPGAFRTKLNTTGTPVHADAFVAKLMLIPTLAVVPFPVPSPTIDFGTVQVGHTSTPQTVTLTNNTNGNIAFTSAVLSGANKADYAASTAGCSPNIVVGTPCVVSVTLTPTVVAPPSEVATLTITDGDSTSPQVFNLMGKGSAAPPPECVRSDCAALHLGNDNNLFLFPLPILGPIHPVTCHQDILACLWLSEVHRSDSRLQEYIACLRLQRSLLFFLERYQVPCTHRSPGL
jgi:Abnormal spindle-like microcephaly-assoc'd, ASPM-SPD-2-Hydin